MSERHQNPEKMPRRFVIDLGEKQFELKRTDTTIYKHSEEPQYDHFYHITDDDPENEGGGLVFFREHLSNFDALANLMERDGFTVISEEVASDNDKHIYREHFGVPEPMADVEMQVYELTDRQERLIRHFGATVMAMPDDLLYDELVSEHPHPHTDRWI